jgi:hypothetical protein
LPSTLVPLASHFLAGSILSLVLPIAVVIAILVWYWIVWRRGTEERAWHVRRAARDLPPTHTSESEPPGA